MNEIYGIAAFRSRQQVFRFEQQLRREGVNNIQIVSTPRDISVGCGLSLRFQIYDAPTVISAARRMPPSGLIGVYQVERQGNARPRLTAMTR